MDKVAEEVEVALVIVNSSTTAEEDSGKTAEEEKEEEEKLVKRAINTKSLDLFVSMRVCNWRRGRPKVGASVGKASCPFRLGIF